MTSRSTTRKASGRGVFENLRWECSHCGRPLKVIVVELFGRPTEVPCWGSCGCEESKWDGMDLDREDRRYARAGIPRRYLKADCDTGGWEADVASGTSLYVQGPYGSGKTHYACVVAKRLVDMGRSVVFTSMPNLVRAVQRSYGGERTDLLDRATGCDVLVLDDLGKEKVTADTLYIAFLLVDGRYSEGKPTVFTSNFARGELGKRLAESDPETAKAIASRLNEGTAVVEMDGGDRRLA